MKKYFYLTVVTAMFLFGNAQAQFSVGGGMGATFFMNDDITTPIEQGGLGLGTEFHYGAKLRFGIPLTPVSITAGAYWTKMKSDGTYEDYSVEYKQDLLTFSGGAEFTIMPGPIKPFLAADFLYTKWANGEVNSSSPLGTSSEKLEDATRTGLGIGAGVKFTLLPVIDLELVAKYNMHNLFSKEEGEKEYNTYTITANVLF